MHVVLCVVDTFQGWFSTYTQPMRDAVKSNAVSHGRGANRESALHLCLATCHYQSCPLSRVPFSRVPSVIHECHRHDNSRAYDPREWHSGPAAGLMTSSGFTNRVPYSFWPCINPIDCRSLYRFGVPRESRTAEELASPVSGCWCPGDHWEGTAGDVPYRWV